MSELVTGRANAAATHDLDLVHALAHVLADRLAHFVDTVRNHRHATGHGAAATGISDRAVIAVTARLRQNFA